MSITDTEMLMRLGASIVLGGMIGFERERREQPAGLRTHILVALASATFALVSFHVVSFQHYKADGMIRMDTGRIASNIVVGIGFLGGGAILHAGMTVKGLTTAASLWLVSAIGLAAGGGMILLASAVTGLTLFALVVLWAVVEVPRRRIVRLEVRIDLEGEFLGRVALIEHIEPIGAVVTDVDYRRDLTSNRSRMDICLKLPRVEMEEPLMKRLEELPRLLKIKVRRPL